jgi:superkiller protein 3
LGDIFAKQEFWGEALERYREVRRKASDAIAASLGEATMLLRLGRAMEALPVAEVLMSRLPDDIEVLLLAATARGEVGDVLGAFAALDSACRVAPARPDVHRLLGDIAQKRGDADAAMAAYHTALQLDPQFSAARYQLAMVLMARRLWPEAEAELLLLVLDGAPMYARAVIALAQLRRTVGRPEDALEPLIGLLQRDPYHFEALTGLGEALHECNRMQDAIVAFRRVLRFDPAHLGALFHEGVVLARLERYRAAMDRFQQVIDLAPVSEYAQRAQREIQSATDLERQLARRAAS